MANSRVQVETVRDLMGVLIDYCPDTKICVTTSADDDPGWDDYLIGVVEYDEDNLLEFQAIKRLDVED